MKPLELSPERFRVLAGNVVALSAEYLASLDTCSVFPKTSGAETERLFAEEAPEHGMGERAFDGLSEVFAHSRADNGRFFGYVKGSAEPVAALGDLVTSILNQNTTAWRSSPAAVTIERTPEIAAIARAHDLWMHVDGAYGALAAIAVPQKFAGLAQADSLSLDPHKWLYQPVDCGCLLYRDAGVARIML
jgi:glutamate/tyrosine decarboxylase-like PLP-dependent enzyme